MYPPPGLLRLMDPPVSSLGLTLKQCACGQSKHIWPKPYTCTCMYGMHISDDTCKHHNSQPGLPSKVHMYMHMYMYMYISTCMLEGMHIHIFPKSRAIPASVLPTYENCKKG